MATGILRWRLIGDLGVAAVEVDHLPGVALLLVPDPRLLRLSGVGAFVPAWGMRREREAKG